MDVFGTDEDRLAYLRFLKKYAAQYNLSIYAYCLMTSRVHLVAVPGDEMALGKALRDAHTVCAMHFNTRTALSRHVWQGRFYFCPLDEQHLWGCRVCPKRTIPERETGLLLYSAAEAGLVERAE